MNGSDLDHSSPDDMPLPPNEGGGFFDAPEPAAPPSATPYRVLARKYRPQNFDDLIGQDATVRILRRAFQLGRVAHAFMLTGVRGVGKTTTARIIARALNCIGVDGKGGPTAEPCGVCANCTAILADRHPDVLEMDAASRTGVDDVREIIEATRFRPMQARMKVFIIDEVHMLSRNAFNALLKTLEEPPAQVTFIFATTELRKVPVTVLSRCQRFDMRRVPQELLAQHFGRIAEKEGAHFSEDALALIARAADGSVRDGLSLLDQAIAQGEGEGAACVEAPMVADMLGLADRQLVFDLLDAIMRGRTDAALDITGQTYARGADLGVLLTDLLELLHTVSRLKAIPALRDSRELPEAERQRGSEFADRLSVATLGRAWQMLLKGLNEVEAAPDRRSAAEMVLIRLCHASTLPTPDQLARRLASGVSEISASGGERPDDGGGTNAMASTSLPQGQEGSGPRASLRLVANGGVVYEQPPQLAPEPQLTAPDSTPQSEESENLPPLRSWREMVAFVGRVSEPILHGILRNGAHLVRFAPPEVAIRMQEGTPPRTEARLQALLERYYPGTWRIVPSREEGEPTIDEQGAEVIELRRQELHAHPLLKAILEAFPDASVGEPRDMSLDEYGLPPEELEEVTQFGGGDDVPDLEFAPLDADLLDDDDMRDHEGPGY
ncbi:DNA polymerase III subunit gamma/tau [Kozakia baliensis]|uniref:DNA polymerase III subunit gamma/tau n=1 Tax=Kozakia baliensis TaxID=153496 RepID=A0A1D8UWX8_9PROT|nr:DNA polymerase III subunit gamma/tau [Kozakia baliensis]AOX18071.1 DNA polymerase III subunit gamma/tau [Kozakia baliensis]GEL63760.1 DNA polymerase III subunit gamma/tau [Kozakia baliensis]